MSALKTGDIVLVKWGDDAEVAEIRSVSDAGYKIFLWAELKAPRKPVSEESILSVLPAHPNQKHRFSVGSEVAVDWRDGYWYPAVVTGHILGGYSIDWVGDDSGSSQALHEQVAARPRNLAGQISPGTRIVRSINSPDEEPYYDPGTVRVVYRDEYEVLWDHGEVSRIQFRDALTLPDAGAALEAEPIVQSATESNTSGITEAEYFRRYVAQRRAAGTVTAGKSDDLYFCSHCRQRHRADWLADGKYHIKFYLCEAGSAPGVVVRELDGKELPTMPVHEFSNLYYAGETRKKGLLQRYAVSALEFGLFGSKIAIKKQ